MDRTALLQRAAEVRRQIFASLPFELRVAIVFARIARETGYLDNLGRLLGHEFLRAGVQDMPEPGPNYKPESKNAPFTLPHGYMGRFMSDVYGLLIKSFHDPSIAEEALLGYLAKIGRSIKLESRTLTSVESFVRHGIFNEARTLARKKLRERAHTESLEDVDDDAPGVRRDVADPHALPDADDAGVDIDDMDSTMMWTKWMDFLRRHENTMVPRSWAAMAGFLSKKHPHIMDAWMGALAKIHPDMPQYFKLLLEGRSSAEIVGNAEKVDGNGRVIKPAKPSMLDHYVPKPYDPVYWDKTYLRKLVPYSVAFFSKMHEQITDAPAISV